MIELGLEGLTLFCLAPEKAVVFTNALHIKLDLLVEHVYQGSELG